MSSRFAILAVVTLMIAPLVSASEAPSLSQDDAPTDADSLIHLDGVSLAGGIGSSDYLEFDVWVNGAHSKRLFGSGVPVEGNLLLNWVYVDIVPLTNTWAGVSAEVTITPLLGGSYTIGIGYRGFNTGLTINGVAGQTFRIVLDWSQSYLFFATGYDPACDQYITLQVDDLGLSTATRILATKGPAFSEDDALFLRLHTDMKLTASKIFTFRLTTCDVFVLEMARVPSGITQAEVRFREWKGTITSLPSSIHFDTFPQWHGHKHVAMNFGGGASGTFSGSVEKFGVMVPISVQAQRLESADIGWSGSAPWITIGSGPKFPGDYVSVDVSGNFGMTATRLSNGNVYFDNSYAIDNSLAPNTCAAAFYGAAQQCAL